MFYNLCDTIILFFAERKGCARFMKCRMFFDCDLIDSSGLEDYAVAYDEKNNFVHIEFDSEEAREAWEKMNLQFYCDKGYQFFALDESGKRHKFSADGVDNAISPKKYSYRKRFKQQCAVKRKYTRTNQQIKSCVKKFGKSGIFAKKASLGKYKAYTYVDYENSFSFPFRFKKCDSSTPQPLVVYFHGAGALGFDNIKPLYEFRSKGKSLKGFDANILLPQSPKYTNTIYFDSVKRQFLAMTNLIKELCKNEAVDPNRIYLVGTSYGGCCVWQMLWDNPDMFACGVPVMGLFSAYFEDKAIKLDRIKNIPIWIAHSSDDDNVSIESDDYCFEQLKKLNAPVKYTRLDKYGHSMSKYFYRDEAWAEWMFSQRKSD